MVKTASEIWADGPGSSPYEPPKPDIREWGARVESYIGAIGSSGGVVFDDKASVDASRAYDANTMAWVVADDTPANNGIYKKIGASGSGSWVRVADLPYSYVAVVDDGTSRANAMSMDATVPVGYGALIAVQVPYTNTDTAVTIAFNGGTPMGVKTASLNNPPVGSLIKDMVILGFIDDVNMVFHLLSDISSAAIQAASEAAASAAAASAAKVNLPSIVSGDARKILVVKADETGYQLVADVHVSSTASLKALPVDVGTFAYLATNMAPGAFILRNWSDYSAIGAVDTDEGYVVRSTVDTSKCWVRVTEYMTPEMFGAAGDGVTNDYDACKMALDVAKAASVNLYMPLDYLWDLTSVGTAEWDPTIYIRGAYRAISIYGAGATKSSITIQNATSIGWYIHSKSGRHWFNPTISRITVRGALAGPLLAIGRNDFADFANMIDSDDLAVENSLDDANNRAVRLNGIYGGSIRRPRFVSYALAVADVLTAVNGYALECRQAEFISVDAGGIGNAASAVRVVDGYNNNLSFTAVTMENVDYCFDHQSATSGHHKLTVCQMTNVRQSALRSGGILSNAKIVVEEPNISGGTYTGVDAASYDGVLIRDRAGVTTPSVPATTVAVANTTGRDVEVSYWGAATVSSITVDGFGRGITATSGTYLLRAGSSTSITYTGSLNWLWTNVG